MLPILIHMIDEKGNSMFGLAQEELDQALDQAAEAIPLAVPEIFWLLAPRRYTDTRLN
jgi:uncharacterized protein